MSILDRLVMKSIVDMNVGTDEEGTGLIEIVEMCDRYYTTTLTKEEFIQLGHEIIEEASKL